MKQIWWKALAVVLLIYVIIAGMTRPLMPGIDRVSPEFASTGESKMILVNTYNTNYSPSEPVQAWLRIDSNYVLAAKEVKVIHNTQLEVFFDIPTYLPSEKANGMYTLLLNDAVNEAFVLPEAIKIKQAEVNILAAKQNWKEERLPALNRKDAFAFPFRKILWETIRNLFFHVPLWFGMVFIFLFSAIYSGRFLQKGDALDDLGALSLTKVGVLYGLLGCLTGAIWAKHTWGTWWTTAEVKLNMSAIAMLIYLAYFVLRSSFEDEEKRARISAVYNIFAFVAMVPLLFVVPRMAEFSMHPGNGGNPGFGGDDLDNNMRYVFYPAIIGWTLLGFWIATLLFRIEKLWYKTMDDE